MQLKATDTQGKNYRVYLDGRLVPYATAADDVENWVDIIDQKYIGMVAPISTESSKIEEVFIDEVEIKTKRLYGKVELKMIPLSVKNK